MAICAEDKIGTAVDASSDYEEDAAGSWPVPQYY